MKINKKEIISILFLLLECIVAYICCSIIPANGIIENMKLVGWLAIITGMFTSIIVYFSRRELNTFFIFIVLCYLFAFGQCILVALNYEPFKGTFGVANGFFSAKEIRNSAKFILISIPTTVIGYCLFKNNKYECYDGKPEYYNSKALIRVSWIVVILTIMPTYYLLYQDIITISTLGYGATLESATGIMKLFTLCSGLFQGCILALYCFEEKHRKILFAIIGIFLALQLIGGSRISVFKFVVIMLVVSQLLRKEITKKNWVIIVIAGMFLIFVFSLVSSIRNAIFMTNDIKSLVKVAMNRLIKNNFLVEAVREMGNTQCINTLVYSTCPDRVPYNFGLSYVRSVYQVIPNIFGLSYNTTDTVFSKLYTVTKSGMGSSYIAEAYWNFGYFSLLLFILYGYIWGKMIEVFKKVCHKGGNARVAFGVVYVMFFFIFSVRGDTIEFCRSMLYYCLLPIALSKIRFCI